MQCLEIGVRHRVSRQVHQVSMPSVLLTFIAQKRKRDILVLFLQSG